MKRERRKTDLRLGLVAGALLFLLVISGFWGCDQKADQTTSPRSQASTSSSADPLAELTASQRSRAQFYMYDHLQKVRRIAQLDPRLSPYLTHQQIPLEEMSESDRMLVRSFGDGIKLDRLLPTREMLDRASAQGESSFVFNPLRGEELQFGKRDNFSRGDVYVQEMTDPSLVDAYRDVYAVGYGNADLRPEYGLRVYYLRIYGADGVLAESFWHLGGAPAVSKFIVMISEEEYNQVEKMTPEERKKWIDDLNSGLDRVFTKPVKRTRVTEENWRQIPVIRTRFKSLDEVPAPLRDYAQKQGLF